MNEKDDLVHSNLEENLADVQNIKNKKEHYGIKYLTKMLVSSNPENVGGGLFLRSLYGDIPILGGALSNYLGATSLGMDMIFSGFGIFGLYALAGVVYTRKKEKEEDNKRTEEQKIRCLGEQKRIAADKERAAKERLDYYLKIF